MTKTKIDYTPRAFRNKDLIAARRAMLRLPHIAPITQFIARLRAANPGWEFPDCDPLGGGVNAEILFLFEKPGPQGAASSGILSVDNDDATAAYSSAFLKQAGVARERTLFWNVMPGWNGKIAYTKDELTEGPKALRELLALLPKLHAVVLVGAPAQRAREIIAALRPELKIISSAHPSPRVKASYPAKWAAIPAQWAQAVLTGVNRPASTQISRQTALRMILCGWRSALVPPSAAAAAGARYFPPYSRPLRIGTGRGGRRPIPRKETHERRSRRQVWPEPSRRADRAEPPGI
jgi:hypothetical protein